MCGAGGGVSREIAVGRSEVPVQVRRVHVPVRAPLAHGGCLGGDVEGEQAVLLPRRDRSTKLPVVSRS